MEDFLSHNNIFIGFRYDPLPYVLCRGQAVSLSLRQGGREWGLALKKFEGICRSIDAEQFWVVAQKSPMSLKFSDLYL
jgi:hypothetical protein